MVSGLLTMVVVSDDPAFLITFSEWSLKGRLLVWSTRLLVLTRLPLHRLQLLRKSLSMTNSMLLLFSKTSSLTVSLYVEMPYSSFTSSLQIAASWTLTAGLVIAAPYLYYPEKFMTLTEGPKLLVGRVFLATEKTITVADPEEPSGERIVALSPDGSLLDTIAEAMNFTTRLVIPEDGEFGKPRPNGTWTGMIALTMRQEVDFALGPFEINEARFQVVDYTVSIFTEYFKILAGRDRAEVDPWGFLFPLTTFVWVSILVTLIGIMSIMMVIPFGVPSMKRTPEKLLIKTGSFIRIILQQDVTILLDWWWWERIMVGTWMLTTMVLTRSYAGNLISLLAVRRTTLPIQSFQDIVDQPVTAYMQGGTAQHQAFMSAESGVLHDVWGLAKEGRLKLISVSDFGNVETLVKQGDTVFMLLDVTFGNRIIASDFSATSRCDYYFAREEIMPSTAAVAGSQGSPLMPAISTRVLQIIEGGLYGYWERTFNPNYTSCDRVPTRFTVRSSLGLNNIWGTLVILGGGGAASLFIFCLEIIFFRVSQ